MIRFLIIFFGILFASISWAQSDFFKRVDSLITAKTDKPFNGVILLSGNGKINYLKCYGFSNMEAKISLKPDDQFVIGSISKQMTAVLVLQEYELGHLHLHVPIKKYLPELVYPWADTVTIHHLLTHTHGISEDLDSQLVFRPGTQYSYSQIGYDLLSKIIAKTSGKSFEAMVQNLFQRCKMRSSFHPAVKNYKNLARGYMEWENGKLGLIFKEESFNNAPVAAGGFISTAHDLVRWNECLHQGKLLSDSTYKQMISKQPNAIRQHPIFGVTHYGYGITVSDEKDILQLGQTGFTLGFVSMNFYFPKTKASIIVLDNTVKDLYDIKKTFYYHVQVLKIIRENLSVRK